MRKLPINKPAFEAAQKYLCYKCGSTRVVSSATLSDPERNPNLEILGWVCKQCRDDMLSVSNEGKVVFGDEGFLDDNLTFWDVKDVERKLDELNTRLEDQGFRTRF